MLSLTYLIRRNSCFLSNTFNIFIITYGITAILFWRKNSDWFFTPNLLLDVLAFQFFFLWIFCPPKTFPLSFLFFGRICHSENVSNWSNQAQGVAQASKQLNRKWIWRFQSKLSQCRMTRHLAENDPCASQQWRGYRRMENPISIYCVANMHF